MSTRTWRRRASRRLSRWGAVAGPSRTPAARVRERAPLRCAAAWTSASRGRRGHPAAASASRPRCVFDSTASSTRRWRRSGRGAAAPEYVEEEFVVADEVRYIAGTYRDVGESNWTRGIRFSFKAPPWAKRRGRPSLEDRCAARRTPPRAAAASRSSRSSMTPYAQKLRIHACDSHVPQRAGDIHQGPRVHVASAAPVADDDNLVRIHALARGRGRAVRGAPRVQHRRPAPSTRRRQPSTASPSLGDWSLPSPRA